MKKITILFLAVLACSWSLLTAANVKVRTLIPTDSEFSTTGTIVFSWKSGGTSTDIALTREGASRWWGATVIIPDETNFTYSIKTETSATTKDVTEIGGWSPSSYIAKDNLELNIEVQALYMETPNERTFMTGEVPATAEDHDYRISNLQVQDIGNGVTITWDANNLAPYYFISLMDDANTWSFDKFVTVTEGKFTYYYDGTDDIHLGTLIFFPCSYDGTNYLPYVKMYQEALDINFKSVDKIIKESFKAEKKDNTVEVSWNHYPAVAEYEVSIRYDNWGKKQIITTKHVPAKDGKYTVIFDELPGNGDYSITLSAISKDGGIIAYIYSTLTITGFPALGEVELNVLIPSDSDMDITYGVWFEWMDLETQTTAIVKADMDADGVWFSKKINTDKSAIRFRVCNRDDASASNSSYTSPIINTSKVCLEMQYQYAHSWELREIECDATDHDYRITNIQTAVSDPVSTLTFTLTAKDYAPAYMIEMRKSGDYYKTLGVLPYEGSNVLTVVLPYSDAGDYDYIVTPVNGIDNTQVADEVTGTITLTAGNTFMPTNLSATLGTDKQTVTFSWQQPAASGVDHYVFEMNDLGETYTSENIYATSHIVKLYGSEMHYVTWMVYAYDANGVLLAQASHSDVIETQSPDYTPTDLNVTVDGNKATLTWSTPIDVPRCNLYVFDLMTGDELVNDYISGTDGNYSTDYTLKEDKTLTIGWNVRSVSAEGLAMSYSMDGEIFTLVGKTVQPRVPQTKQMTPTIGYLHWDENHSTWSATVYEYDAAQNPLFVFTLTIPGNKSTIPTSIILTNNTNDDNLFSEIPSGSEDPEFGDVIKNANLTVAYNDGAGYQYDNIDGIYYVFAKISGEMSSDFGDTLIVNAPTDFIKVFVPAPDEIYAVWDEPNTTLTLYYDDHRIAQNGVTDWSSYASTATTVVLDASMQDARPTSTAKWFFTFSKMTAIQNLEYLNTSEVTEMSAMFLGCSALTALDLSKFNTENVTNMNGMFYACSSLTSLDLSNFNTAKVEDMSYMFRSCLSLTSLDVSSFNTANVTNMNYMFYYCNLLTSLDLSNFNTAKVTGMSGMFEGCESLKTIYCDDAWNPSSSDNMFYNCTALVGGKGTVYDANHIDKTYARPDEAGNPGYFTKQSTATGFDQVPSDQVPSTKILRDGQLYILRGDKTYDATGRMVKK